jgi:hypothetical protein
MQLAAGCPVAEFLRDRVSQQAPDTRISEVLEKDLQFLALPRTYCSDSGSDTYAKAPCLRHFAGVPNMASTPVCLVCCCYSSRCSSSVFVSTTKLTVFVLKHGSYVTDLQAVCHWLTDHKCCAHSPVPSQHMLRTHPLASKLPGHHTVCIMLHIMTITWYACCE